MTDCINCVKRPLWPRTPAKNTLYMCFREGDAEFDCSNFKEEENKEILTCPKCGYGYTKHELDVMVVRGCMNCKIQGD